MTATLEPPPVEWVVGQQPLPATEHVPVPGRRGCEHPGHPHQHGDRKAYMMDRCRCTPCRAANTAYQNRRARAQAYGRPTTDLVDAAPARAHVLELMKAGMGWKVVAARAGVAQGVVSALLYGKTGRAAAPKRIRPATAQALLAVATPGPADLSPGRVIDGTGTRRRLQALVALGWTQTALAERLGMELSNLGRLLAGGRVTAGRATAVAALYDQLWTRQPPAGPGRDRARKRAAAQGWPGPLAWDDATIDDPAATPHPGGTEDVDEDLVDDVALAAVLDGHRLTLTGATLTAAVHALLDRGRSTVAVAEQLGLDRRTVLALVTRARRTAA